MGTTKEELRTMHIVKEWIEGKDWFKVVDKTGKLLYEHPELWGVTEYVRIQKEIQKKACKTK